MPDNKSLQFDTWLLQSVILANIDGVGTPERIMAAADLMGKTPMVDSDLHAGVIRLVQKGLVEEHNGSYHLTTMVPAMVKWSEREKIRQLVSAEPKPEAAKAPESGNIAKIAGQARDRLQKTTGDYAKRLQGFMSGLTKPKKD